MKYLVIITSIITMSLFSSKVFAKANVKLNILQAKEIKKTKSIKTIETVEYHWIFVGDCIQLLAAVYNSNGDYVTCYLCNGYNYAGTYIHCPPSGQMYC